MRVTAKRGRMNKMVLTPESKIVGASTTLKVEFSQKHDLPRDSYIFIYFPKWNPENPVSSNRKPYIQGTETCEPVKILNTDLICNYQDDRLIVQKAVIAPISANTEMSFTIEGFKNPI